MKNTAYFFIVSISIVTTLTFGKSLLIPFVFAMLLWFISRKMRSLMNKVSFIKKYFPTWIKNTLSSLIIISSLIVISKILSTNINTLARATQEYDSNIGSIVENISQYLTIDLTETLKTQLGNINFGQILSLIFNSITELFGNLFMIVIYVLFIFLEEANFHKKLMLAFSNKEQQKKISTILEEIEASITNYLGLKTLVSFITGFLSYIILLFIGCNLLILIKYCIDNLSCLYKCSTLG